MTKKEYKLKLISILFLCLLFRFPIKMNSQTVTDTIVEIIDTNYVENLNFKFNKPWDVDLQNRKLTLTGGLHYDFDNFYNVSQYHDRWKNYLPSIYLAVNYKLTSTIGLKFHGKFGYNSIYFGPEIQYYLNSKKRIKKGKAGNNFSGNYLFTGMQFYYDINRGGITNRIDWDFEEGAWRIWDYSKVRSIEKQYNLIFGYGMKRKFNNNLWFDAKASAGLNFLEKKNALSGRDNPRLYLNLSLTVGYSLNLLGK